MSEKYAFYHDNKDDTWSAVIVGNVVDKKGEILDALLSRPRDEIDRFVAKHIPEGTMTVYTSEQS